MDCFAIYSVKGFGEYFGKGWMREYVGADFQVCCLQIHGKGHAAYQFSYFMAYHVHAEYLAA